MSRICNNCGSDSTAMIKKTNKPRWYRDKWTGKEGYVCHKCSCKLKYKVDPEKFNAPKREAYEDNKDGYKDRSNEYGRLRRKSKPNERKESYQKNKDKEKAGHREWVSNNKEKAIARNERFIENNPEYYDEYNQAHRPENAARAARRRNMQRNARPPWVDTSVMVAFYRDRPEGHHVDHIHPIQPKPGSSIHGLDVPWNLQYLRADENEFKGNRHDGTYENEGWRQEFAEYQEAKQRVLAEKRQGSESEDGPRGDGLDQGTQPEGQGS